MALVLAFYFFFLPSGNADRQVHFTCWNETAQRDVQWSRGSAVDLAFIYGTILIDVENVQHFTTFDKNTEKLTQFPLEDWRCLISSKSLILSVN